MPITFLSDSIIFTAFLGVSLFLRILQNQPPLYSLTCHSSFWPSTFVTWRRDSHRIEGGVTTSVTRFGYSNVLNTTEEGVYSCDIYSISTSVFRDERGRKTINVTSMFLFNNHKEILYIIKADFIFNLSFFINSTSATNQPHSHPDRREHCVSILDTSRQAQSIQNLLPGQ